MESIRFDDIKDEIKDIKIFLTKQDEKMDTILNEIRDLKTEVRVISKRQDDLEQKFSDYRRNNNKRMDDIEISVQFTQDLMDKKMADLFSESEEKLHHRLECLKMVETKLRRLEDRGRRNNLRIDGIQENENETWDQTERKLQDMVKSRLGLDYVEIERAH